MRTRLKRLLKAPPQPKRPSKQQHGKPGFLTIGGCCTSSQEAMLSYVSEFYSDKDLDTFFLHIAALHTMLSDPRANRLLHVAGLREIYAHLSTQNGLQHFAAMRVEWLLRGSRKPPSLPPAPYWAVDATIEENNQWHTYVAIVPVRSSSAAAVSAANRPGTRINWKRVKKS